MKTVQQTWAELWTLTESCPNQGMRVRLQNELTYFKTIGEAWFFDEKLNAQQNEERLSALKARETKLEERRAGLDARLNDLQGRMIVEFEKEKMRAKIREEKKQLAQEKAQLEQEFIKVANLCGHE